MSSFGCCHKDHPHSSSHCWRLSRKESLSRKPTYPLGFPLQPIFDRWECHFLSISQLKGQFGLQTPGQQSCFWFCGGFKSLRLFLWGGVLHFKALSESTRAKGKPSRLVFRKEVEKSCSMPRRSKLIKPVSLSWFVVVSAGRGASKSKQRNSGRMGFWRELCPFE